MNYLSHPDKLLTDHLMEVYEKGLEYLPSDLGEAYKIISLCHDFGKYTSFFQSYLIDKKKTDYSNHGFISAVFGAFISFERNGEESFLPLLTYNIILHHHGNIDNPSLNLPSNFINPQRIHYEFNLLRKIEAYEVQIKDLQDNSKEIVLDMEEIGLKEEFISFINRENYIFEILKDLKRLDYKLGKIKDESLYFLHQQLYSALIASDKLSASNIKYYSSLWGNYRKLDEIKNKIFNETNSAINKIRTEIFNKVQESIKKQGMDSNIFFITSPTGTGKTYTGFFAALQLREILDSSGKIIYSLPFTSIIEQNFEALEKIYKFLADYEINRSRYLIKHHNQSNKSYESEYRDYKRTQAELLIENWESGVIVTTFVQLLETIVGNRNRMLKKYHNFKDSIIILDEIQSIDIKYYKLIEFVLDKLCSIMNCKIILMTATKPMILSKGIELLEDNEKYYDLFNRTKLIPNLDNISINDFVSDFIDELEEKSYLIVCNTINQSLDIFEKLKVLGREIYYLSTNILPIHRKEGIKTIEESLKKGKNIIVVSTQVVEAGVDLDFDEVIRDIGPLDSIIQCAGRCNRNNKGEIGNVKIYKMVNEKGYPFANNIYGNTLIEITTSILENGKIIEEREYYKLIEKYFSEVMENKSMDDSKKIIESIKTLDFSVGDSAIGKFSLIKNNPTYVDVLFLYDSIAEDAYEEYKKIRFIKNFEDKRESYLEIGQTLKRYILSIPEKYCSVFTIDDSFIILPRIGIEDFYSIDTGFIRNDRGDCLIL